MVKIEYDVEALPEDIPIRGNASASGDEETDRSTEKWIQDQLDAGNRWAWCCIRVQCTIRVGELRVDGFDTLGCSSYLSEADFTRLEGDGYFQDMKRSAYVNTVQTLRRLVEEGERAKDALAELEEQP